MFFLKPNSCAQGQKSSSRTPNVQAVRDNTTSFYLRICKCASTRTCPYGTSRYPIIRRFIIKGKSKTFSRFYLTATNEDTARANLDASEASELGLKYPQSVKIWRDAWQRFVPFLQFPTAARRVLYTTNWIESLKA